jgi:hypothetical protein
MLLLNIKRSARSNVPFMAGSSNGIMITDSADTKSLMKQGIDLSKPVRITMIPYGGFVINNNPLAHPPQR